MAIKINKYPKEGYKFIPESERGEEQPFTAWVKPIGTKNLLELEDSLVQRKGVDSMIFAQNTYEFKLVQLGLVDWDNVFDENGNKIKLQKTPEGIVSEESLNPLPQQIIKELAVVIASITRDPTTIQLFFPDDEQGTEKSEAK